MSDMNFNRSLVMAVGCGCKKYSGQAKYHDLKDPLNPLSSYKTSLSFISRKV